jgi:hypothetical protein
MMEYGGLDAFNKLYLACRTDVDTIENGIKANTERITALKGFRDDIAIYNRTKPIYKQYKEKTLFKEGFRKKHEDEIIAHENAAMYLRDYKKPLPKLKELSAEITKIEAANVNNNKALTKKQTELKQLENISAYLRNLQREHEPPPPPREQTQTRRRSNDLSR